MGSVSLVCPMCCGETFDNSQSLKYHLLSMTDNLYCPNCAERSDSVSALIQHLDTCGDETHEMIKVQPVVAAIENNEQQRVVGDEIESVTVETHEDSIHHSFLATVNEDGIVMVGNSRAMGDIDEVVTAVTAVTEEQQQTQAVEKMDIDEDPSDHDNILDNLVRGDTSVDGEMSGDEKSVKSEKNEETGSGVTEETTELIDHEDNSTNLVGVESLEDHQEEHLDEAGLVQVKEEMCEVDSEALYSCSSCGMSFNSVLSHIKEYHDGQEVVLEMAEQQIDDLPDDTGELIEDEEAPSSMTTSCSRLVDESSSVSSSGPEQRSSCSGGLPRHRQTMNTLRTEECVDSEGRLYTRKVVQIERFWDRGVGAPTGAQSQLQQQQHRQATKNAPMIEKFFSNAEGLKIRAKNPVLPKTTNTTATIPTMATSAVVANATSASVRMYRCNKCLEQFVKLADFRVHACIHGNNQCDLCEQAFASAKALQLHSRIHEAEAEGGNDSNFVCLTCGTEFSSHKSLRLHSRMHAPVRARHVDAPEGTGDENFTCLECGKVLSESYRKAHMALHKGDSVTCSVCNRKFDSADSLAMHAAVHVEFAQLQQQKQEKHQQLQQELASGEVREDEANGEKRSARGKKGGEKTVGGGGVTGGGGGGGGDAPEKPYQCQHCGRRFTRPHEKVKHERIHTGEKPHACEVCGKTFRVSYCLTLHMRTHTGVRPYECQHCGKRFKASSVYNHHLLTHGDERAYTCPYCPKTFKTRVQLAGHKNSHTKPFRCTECSRPFASLYAARAHIQTHKKDNNLKFSCYVCGASYGRAFALKDHLKQHTEQQDILLSGTPEPAREIEVVDADDFIITAETEEYEEIEEIEEIEEMEEIEEAEQEEEEEEHKLIAVAAAASADVPMPDHSRSEIP